MRAAGAAQGDGGSAGGAERPKRTEPTGPRTRPFTCWRKEAAAATPGKPWLKPVTVKVGISDGANTEVLEGLKEGDVVVVGTVSSAASAVAPALRLAARSAGRAGARRI